MANNANVVFCEYDPGHLEGVFNQTCALGDGTYYDILKKADVPLPLNNILPDAHDNWDEWL